MKIEAEIEDRVWNAVVMSTAVGMMAEQDGDPLQVEMTN